LYLQVVILISKVAKNETSTLHYTNRTLMALTIYNYNDQQFNRHDFRLKVSLII